MLLNAKAPAIEILLNTNMDANVFPETPLFHKAYSWLSGGGRGKMNCLVGVVAVSHFWQLPIGKVGHKEVVVEGFQAFKGIGVMV